MKRNEVSYYDEIMNFIKEQIESNFASARRPLKVYCKTGELKKGLENIIEENKLTAKSILDFAASTPPLSLDIFALITDGEAYELLIIEVKLLNSVGLSQLSQLIGYCIVSNAQYGLLVNVTGGESPRLLDLITNEPDITHIVRYIKKSNSTIEHDLGVMEWDEETGNMLYTGYGGIRSLSELCMKLAERFSN